MTTKAAYRAPSMEVLELKTEGAIAQVAVTSYQGFDTKDGETPGTEKYEW